MWTPTYDDKLQPETVASVDAQEHGHQVTWCVDREQAHRAPDHRNVLASYRKAQQRALAEGYDALLTVEHDIVLPEGAVETLASTAGDVVYGVYLLRWGDFVLNTFEYIGDRNLGESLGFFPEKLASAYKAGVVRVSGMGWGCTLIRRKALETVDLPATWPENPPYDVMFARRCVQAKLKMMANFDILCGHMKHGRMLMPADQRPVKHNGFAVSHGGQLMPHYVELDGGVVKLKMRQTLRYKWFGESVKLTKGHVYDIDWQWADDLLRAGCAEVVDVS